MTRRRTVGVVLFTMATLGALYVLVPSLAGAQDTWRRLENGDPWWLGAALCLEALSFAGYLVLFRAVFDRQRPRLLFGETYDITMAGVAATRLLATAGAGGVVLTAWALRRFVLQPAAVATGLTTFLVLLYAVFMAALLLVGVGLSSGVLSGAAPLALTVVPAVFGGGVILAVLALALVPRDLASRVEHAGTRAGVARRILSRVAVAPAAFGSGVRGAIELVGRRDPRLLGAIAWWGFDVAVLWACFHAFGDPPALGILVMAYFVGMLGNLLPLPGGVGGVDGGMIGTLIACDVSAGLSIVAVLAYRAFAFWLPTLPGVIAYLRLHRRLQHQPAATARPVRRLADGHAAGIGCVE
jgi:uncharacterized protein (TIRG00374 family)